MKPTARELAMRDPALAAFVGVHGQSDFGADFGFGFGADSMGAAPGVNPGGSGRVPHPHPAALAQLHPAHQQMLTQAVQRQNSSASRQSILDPNANSDIKVERYAFSLNQSITLGTALAGWTQSNQPAVTFRPQQLTVNVPAPGFCTLSLIQVANVVVTVGATGDAWEYNALSVNSELDMPTLSPANKATISGSYTGYVPVGYSAASAYTLCMTFKGPASIVA